MDSIEFIGNLGRDPVMRYTSGKATAVTDFSVCCNRSYTNDDGKRVVEPKWYKVTAWGKLAEACNNCLKKGSKVFVHGRLNADKNGNCPTFTRADGTAGANFEVTAETVEFLSPKSGAGSGSTNETSGQSDEEQPPASVPF
jgi:single-strand DNA-binding protein